MKFLKLKNTFINFDNVVCVSKEENPNGSFSLKIYYTNYCHFETKFQDEKSMDEFFEDLWTRMRKASRI